MNNPEILKLFLFYLVLLPGACLCFFPMKNHLRLGVRKTIPAVFSLTLLVIILLSFIDYRYNPRYNALILPMVFVCYLIYHSFLKVHYSQSLSAFVLVWTFFTFIANYANGFDAMHHPENTIEDFSIEAAGYQLLLGILFTVLFAYPMLKYGSRMIDNFHIYSIWLISISISGVFLVYNLMIIPRRYEVLQNAGIFRFYWMSLTLLMMLLLLLCIIFYCIVDGILEMSKAQEKAQILEMEEIMYGKQQVYLEKMAKMRHDSKHAINTLETLIMEKDLDAALDFMKEYRDAMPVSEVTQFCPNPALNALLNHHAQEAQQNQIECSWQINLDEDLPIKDLDLCSMIGNILENAIRACREVPVDQRFIQLAVTVPFGKQFCIVATNSFSGKIIKKGNLYQTTSREGSGLGLRSINSVAEQYGGSAEFTHKGNTFYSDVIIPLPQIQK